MEDFCSKCDNLLIYVPRVNGTIKECQTCHIPTNMQPTDSLRYSVSKIEMTIDSTMLNFAKNLTNKKIARKCKKCGHGFARILRIADMTTYVKCTKCDHLRIWDEE